MRGGSTQTAAVQAPVLGRADCRWCGAALAMAGQIVRLADGAAHPPLGPGPLCSAIASAACRASEAAGVERAIGYRLGAGCACEALECFLAVVPVDI